MLFNVLQQPSRRGCAPLCGYGCAANPRRSPCQASRGTCGWDVSSMGGRECNSIGLAKPTLHGNIWTFVHVYTVNFVCLPGNLYIFVVIHKIHQKFFSCSRLPTAALDQGRIPASAGPGALSSTPPAIAHLGVHVHPWRTRAGHHSPPWTWTVPLADASQNRLCFCYVNIKSMCLQF